MIQTHFNPLWPTYRAFNSSTNAWLSKKNDTTPWIQYRFTSKKLVKAVTLKNGNATTDRSIKKLTIQGGDGTEFDDLATYDSKNIAVSAESKYKMNNKQMYQIYRLQVIENNLSTNASSIEKLQFYGKN